MTDYLENVAIDAEALAADADALVSAVTGGPARQTVSMRVALAARDGRLWGCWFCAFLSACVQRRHCEHTLAGDAVPWWVFLTAGFWFALALLGAPAAVWWLL